MRRELGCHRSLELNLDVYEKVARVAGQNGAKIIVFPEDGLFDGSRSFILPCLHQLPDPDSLLADQTINPCLEQEYNDNFIMKRLSCLARSNKLYLVANFGTREECKWPWKEENAASCAKYGYLMLNTDVVFDQQGNFIKRYRKYNPFVEVFDKAPQLELAYFDTPDMGRFGLFTCFDILFKSPAIDLVEKYQVNTALYPTWWFDKLPMHSAIQYQEAWAQSNRLNLLAANLVLPERGSIGGGIFSSSSKTNPIYTGANDLDPKLIVADLPAQQTSNDDDHDEPCTCSGENNKSAGFKVAVELADILERAKEASKPYGAALVRKYKPYGHFEVDSKDSVVVALRESQDDVTVCLSGVCCHLEYQTSSPQTNLVLIVKSGLNKPFRWWEQVCLLATVTSSVGAQNDNHRLSVFDLEGRVEFSRLSISANFTTKYVMPIASRNVSQLVNRTERQFHCRQVSSPLEKQTHCKQEVAGLINSFGFFGRQFEKDEPMRLR